MSAFIETRTRGTFHVTDDPRAARAALREGSAAGNGALFRTQIASQLVEIRYDEVLRVRKPGELSRARRRARGLALAFASLVCTCAGTLGVCLGGAALLATVFGHAGDITVPWYAAIPGFATYYAGGWLGHEACNVLGVE